MKINVNILVLIFFFQIGFSQTKVETIDNNITDKLAGSWIAFSKTLS